MQFDSVTEEVILLAAQVEVVHEWIEAGLLPGIRLGSELQWLRVRARDLENFIDKNLLGQMLESAQQKIQSSHRIRLVGSKPILISNQPTKNRKRSDRKIIDSASNIL